MNRLPTELIFEVISHFAVDDDHDCSSTCSYLSQLAALALTSRRLNQIATPLIYLHDVAHANRAILSGAYTGCVGTLQRSRAWGGDATRLGPIRRPGFSPDAAGTALQVAAHGGHLEAVKYLLEIGADINAVGVSMCECEHGDFPYWPTSPWSALHTAICQGFDDVARLLISEGANFVLSREHGNQINERHFIRKGMVVIRTGRGVHVLEEVTKRKRLDLFKFLLQHKETLDLGAYAVDSITPLHRVAAITDKPEELEFMRLLLENGAKLYPDAYRDRHLNTPLPFDRAFMDWVAEVEESGFMLRDKGQSYTKLMAFLNYFSKHLPAHLPTLMGRVLEIWMERGEASLDSAWSLLYHTFKLHGIAIPSPSLIREWVLDALRRPKIEPLGDMTVSDVLTFLPTLGFPTSLLHPLDPLLFSAAKSALTPEARWLVDHGANPNALDPHLGTGPLHLAAVSEDLDLLEMLLARGADVHAPDATGCTAVKLATRFRRDKAVAVLKRYGAEVDGCRGGGGGSGRRSLDRKRVKGATRVC